MLKTQAEDVVAVEQVGRPRHRFGRALLEGRGQLLLPDRVRHSETVHIEDRFGRERELAGGLVAVVHIREPVAQAVT